MPGTSDNSFLFYAPHSQHPTHTVSGGPWIRTKKSKPFGQLVSDVTVIYATATLRTRNKRPLCPVWPGQRLAARVTHWQARGTRQDETVIYAIAQLNPPGNRRLGKLPFRAIGSMVDVTLTYATEGIFQMSKIKKAQPFSAGLSGQEPENRLTGLHGRTPIRLRLFCRLLEACPEMSERHHASEAN